MRRANEHVQELVVFTVDHGSLTGDTEMMVAAPPWPMQIDRISYLNLTGLAVDASNFFELSLQVEGTPVATHSTETGADGAIGAGVEVELAVTLADSFVAAGDVITFLADETGTATLPAGRLVVYGRRLDT
jgi:hypothetical protein